MAGYQQSQAYLPESFVGYPPFFPSPITSGGISWLAGPGGSPRRQTLADALRQQEQGNGGPLYSHSNSQPGLTPIVEEEPIPGFPIFQPRQILSASLTNTAESQTERRAQRQKPRGVSPQK